jgi:tetratricopeptide (TPR) repeat protein
MNSTPLFHVSDSRVRYRTIEAQRVVPVFLGVLCVIALVAATDIWLAGVAARHRLHTGEELFKRGIAAATAGRHDQALHLFRSAYNHSPGSAQYQLAFARSLRTNGRLPESRAAVQNLLARSPSHGAANAEFARILAGEGDWRQAVWYYHRALYGAWSDSPDLRVLRFELADFARAQFGAGKYLAAERNFRRALNLGAVSESAERELSLAAEVNELDPTIRRLPAIEKHRRSHQLTSTLLQSLMVCAPNNAELEKHSVTLGMDQGTKNPLAASEADLELFAELWEARTATCKGEPQYPPVIELLAAQLIK